MRLTGCPVDELGLEPTGIIPVPPMGGAVSMPAELIEQRPDVRAAKATAEAAVKNLKSAKSDFFPTLSLSGNIGTTATAVSALGASGTGVAGLAAALAMPILNWGTSSPERKRRWRIFRVQWRLTVQHCCRHWRKQTMP